VTVQRDLEVKVGAEGQSGAADAADPLPGPDLRRALGQSGRDLAEMGVERAKPVMLDHDLQPAHAAAIDADYAAIRHSPHPGARRRAEIGAPMISARNRLPGNDPRPEGRGHTARRDRNDQRRQGDRGDRRCGKRGGRQNTQCNAKKRCGAER
jgi:hypothetical protein